MSRMQTVAAAAPDRRGFLGLLFTLPALGAIDAWASRLPVAADDDLALIMACQHAAALYDRADAIGATGDDDAALIVDEERWALCDHIASMRATTLPAMQSLAALIIKTDGNARNHGGRIFDPGLVSTLVYSLANAGIGPADARPDEHPGFGGVA